MVFNITDGEASDGDHETLVSLAGQIRDLHTNDGNALLININLAAAANATPVVFPSSAGELPEGRYTRMLFDMSSVMPAAYDEAIGRITGCSAPFHAMACNASIADMITMLDIGSRSVNKML